MQPTDFFTEIERKTVSSLRQGDSLEAIAKEQKVTLDTVRRRVRKIRLALNCQSDDLSHLRAALRARV
jgi:DNA-binding NarL/FixJ family response regulator